MADYLLNMEVMIGVSMYAAAKIIVATVACGSSGMGSFMVYQISTQGTTENI